jgi:hypothetical protein
VGTLIFHALEIGDDIKILRRENLNQPTIPLQVVRGCVERGGGDCMI